MQNTYIRERRILAHRVLRQLTGMALIVSDSEQQDKNLYKSKGYFPLSIVSIRAEIQDKTFEEIHEAALLLVENNHATINANTMDIFYSIVKVSPEGEIAYKAEYYLKLNKEDKDESIDKWQKRNWAWIAFFTFAIGWIGDFGKEEIQLKCNQSKTTDNRVLDSTSGTQHVSNCIQDTGSLMGTLRVKIK